MNLSKNGVGFVVLLVSLLGGDISESDIATTLSTLGQLIGLVLMAWNQYARPNVRKFIFKDE